MQAAGRGVIGTAGFASPEAISSSRRKLLDKKCDVFSLACIVVHMITGQPPYVSEAEAAECDVLLVQHKYARMGKTNPDIRPPLQRLKATVKVCEM